MFNISQGSKQEIAKEQTFLQAEIGWWIIGWPAKGISGFGVLNDNGRNRVPKSIHISKKTKTKTKIHVLKIEFEIQKRMLTFGRTTNHDHGDDFLLRHVDSKKPRFVKHDDDLIL